MLGYVSRVKDVESNVDEDTVTSGQIESNAVRCPDTDAAEQMYKGMKTHAGAMTSQPGGLRLPAIHCVCCMQSLTISAKQETHVVVRSLVLFVAVRKDWAPLYLAS